MIGALACFLTGAILLVEHEVEGIVVGRPNPLTGAPALNFRSADLDADGLQDILLSDRLLLQRLGEFPPALSIALPRISENPEYDVFDGKLYLRSSGRLEKYGLKGVDWEVLDSWRVEWPQEPSASSEQAPDENTGASGGRLGRFLHDISNDGLPEILIPTSSGLQIFAKRDDGYRPDQTLDVYAPPTAILQQIPIWPKKSRALSFPMSRLRFRLVLDGPSVILYSSSTDLDTRVRHRVKRWEFTRDGGHRAQPGDAPPFISNAIPAFLQPCRLNADDTPDFAGVRSTRMETSLVPERVIELVATTDGGKTLQTFRSKSFQSLCAFVDVNGDGRRDAIVESTGLFSGGLREFLVKSMGERRISHTLRVHYQDEAGVFSKVPSLQHHFSITLTRPPFRHGKIFSQYQKGELVNVTGDFDGDGKRDLLVRTHPDRLSIYLNQGSAFSSSPDRTATLTEHERFGVADVDGDGRTDIVVFGHDSRDAEAVERTRVFFSRKAPV